MDKVKRQKLEEQGWKVENAEDFLGLSTDEIKLIELKLALTRNLREYRTKEHLSQKELAARMESSQSRVAKIEGGDPSVSLDLIFKAFFSLGLDSQDIVKILQTKNNEGNHLNTATT